MPVTFEKCKTFNCSQTVLVEYHTTCYYCRNQERIRKNIYKKIN